MPATFPRPTFPTDTPQPIAADFHPRALSTPADAADLLPPAARQILLDLRERRASLHSDVLRLSDEISGARAELNQIRNRVRQLTGSKMDGGFQLDETNALVQTERAKETKVAARITELTARQTKYRDQRAPLGQLLENCERFVLDQAARGHTLRSADRSTSLPAPPSKKYELRSQSCRVSSWRFQVLGKVGKGSGRVG
jgi:chromosome segregation ATPase